MEAVKLNNECSKLRSSLAWTTYRVLGELRVLEGNLIMILYAKLKGYYLTGYGRPLKSLNRKIV